MAHLGHNLQIDVRDCRKTTFIFVETVIDLAPWLQVWRLFFYKVLLDRHGPWHTNPLSFSKRFNIDLSKCSPFANIENISDLALERNEICVNLQSALSDPDCEILVVTSFAFCNITLIALNTVERKYQPVKCIRERTF